MAEDKPQSWRRRTAKYAAYTGALAASCSGGSPPVPPSQESIAVTQKMDALPEQCQQARAEFETKAKIAVAAIARFGKIAKDPSNLFDAPRHIGIVFKPAGAQTPEAEAEFSVHITHNSGKVTTTHIPEMLSAQKAWKRFQQKQREARVKEENRLDTANLTPLLLGYYAKAENINFDNEPKLKSTSEALLKLFMVTPLNNLEEMSRPPVTPDEQAEIDALFTKNFRALLTRMREKGVLQTINDDNCTTALALDKSFFHHDQEKRMMSSEVMEVRIPGDHVTFRFLPPTPECMKQTEEGLNPQEKIVHELIMNVRAPGKGNTLRGENCSTVEATLQKPIGGYLPIEMLVVNPDVRQPAPTHPPPPPAPERGR